jgi:hypothetical protein
MLVKAKNIGARNSYTKEYESRSKILRIGSRHQRLPACALVQVIIPSVLPRAGYYYKRFTACDRANLR